MDNHTSLYCILLQNHLVYTQVKRNYDELFFKNPAKYFGPATVPNIPSSNRYFLCTSRLRVPERTYSLEAVGRPVMEEPDSGKCISGRKASVHREGPTGSRVELAQVHRAQVLVQSGYASESLCDFGPICVPFWTLAFPS